MGNQPLEVWAGVPSKSVTSPLKPGTPLNKQGLIHPVALMCPVPENDGCSFGFALIQAKKGTLKTKHIARHVVGVLALPLKNKVKTDTFL